MSSYNNQVSLLGRLTADPEVKTVGEHKVLNFRIAVNKRTSKTDGHPTANFFNCTAWDKLAEVIEKYFKKGDRIGVRGSLESSSYEEDGSMYANGKSKTRTAIDIRVDDIEFIEKKADTGTSVSSAGIGMSMGDVEDDSDDLPF